MREDVGDDVEVFHPTSGRVTGALVLPLAGAVVILGLVDGSGGVGPRVATGAVLLAVLAWAAMLRPRVEATREHLVLRNMLERISLPWAAIEEMALRQVLAVRVGERRYVSPAVGRPLRKVLRNQPVVDPTAASGGVRPPTEVPYADYVETEIRRRMTEGREAAGVRPGSPEQLALADGVRREPAWLPIVLLALSALAFVASFFL